MSSYINDNAKFYNSIEWKKKRLQILKRDKYKCKICARYGKNVDADVVHHIVEINEDWSKRLLDSNLVSLCHLHHNQIHKAEEITFR